jgi:hypothetical protein
VAPLSQAVRSEGSRLYPDLAVADGYYTLLTPDLASVPRGTLTEHVTNLARDWSRITAAIDILFTGI